MTDYISREAAKYVLRERYRIKTHFHDMESAAQLKCAELEIGDIPAADVVPTGAYNQAAWERDTAIEQLKQIGKSFGEQMDDVRPVVLCRDCVMYECHEYDGGLKYVCRLFKRQMQETDFCSYGEKREES